MTRAKRKAAAEGRTLASLIEDGIMLVLDLGEGSFYFFGCSSHNLTPVWQSF